MEKTRKEILGIGIIILVLIISGFLLLFNNITGKATHSNEEERIKIGGIFPLSGNGALLGQDNRDAAILAARDLEKQGIIIELYFEDSKSDPKEGVTAAQKLININNVSILQTTLSSVTTAVAPIAEENKVLMLYTSTTNDPAEKYDYVFKDFADITNECRLMAQTYISNEYDKVAYLALTTPSAKVCYDVLKEELESKGGKIVAKEDFNSGETDFLTLLTKIKKSNPDVIFTYSLKETENIVEQMKKSGLEVPISCYLKDLLCGNQKYIDANPKAFEGAISTTPAFDIESPENKELKGFISRFEKEYKRKPLGPEAVYTYDDIIMIGRASKSCGNDNLCIKDYLLTHEFDSITGEKVRFDANGLITRNSVPIKYTNGNWERIN